MTIYVAICDDNIADRKHTERLLGREKDSRLLSGSQVLYIDSFGSSEALMHTPMKYDIFFIDMTSGSENGMDVAKALRKKGIAAPIVMCRSLIDYSSFVNSPENLIFIDKPMNQGQVSHLVDVAGQWTEKKTPLIELRGQQETFFIPYTDIVRAVSKGAFVTEVSLSDGSYITIADSFKSIRTLCRSHPSLIECGRDMVNILHVVSCDDEGLHLSNGDCVKYHFHQKDRIFKAYVETLASLCSKKV